MVLLLLFSLLILNIEGLSAIVLTNCALEGLFALVEQVSIVLLDLTECELAFMAWYTARVSVMSLGRRRCGILVVHPHSNSLFVVDVTHVLVMAIVMLVIRSSTANTTLDHVVGFTFD